MQPNNLVVSIHACLQQKQITKAIRSKVQILVAMMTAKPMWIRIQHRIFETFTQIPIFQGLK